MESTDPHILDEIKLTLKFKKVKRRRKLNLSNKDIMTMAHEPKNF